MPNSVCLFVVHVYEDIDCKRPQPYVTNRHQGIQNDPLLFFVCSWLLFLQ